MYAMIARTQMKLLLLLVFRQLLARTQFFSFNSHLFKLQLRSLGILNSETEEATGEPLFLRRLFHLNPRVIVDVGANDRAYGQDILVNTYIFAFEPHPVSFERLKKDRSRNVIPVKAAVGDKVGKTQLWDFADHAPRKPDQPTSQLATLHPKIITDLYHQPAKKYSVNLTSLDAYFADKKIKRIDLLKIDAEGNELAVLKGAKKLLKANRIEMIQFEFNETHAFSHVLMKDFYDQLPDFNFYRLLPSGMAPLGAYRPLTHEIFGFQNIVAIYRDSPLAQIIQQQKGEPQLPFRISN